MIRPEKINPLDIRYYSLNAESINRNTLRIQDITTQTYNSVHEQKERDQNVNCLKRISYYSK
jgi:hypothetical protein